MIDAQARREPHSPDAFDWPLAIEAEEILRHYLDQFLAANAFAKALSERMRNETATDFFEWIDHFVLETRYGDSLATAGFEPQTGCDTPQGETVLAHPKATLPRIRIQRGGFHQPFVIALRPESVADFAGAHSLRTEITGEPFSRYRRLIAAQERETSLEAVERHGYCGFLEAPLTAAALQGVIKAKELWQTRPRFFAEETEGFRVANEILTRAEELAGRDLACQYFFDAERRYWQGRNYAARIQKHRQDRLGLGWGNHDHHTFRCSRGHFVELIEFLLRLGFHKRERFYAGAQAGWGAQILEHPATGIVVFADVDLLPEETEVDFSTFQLPPASRLGTVGLWVGLHGESFLQAGMHHLEARFDFDLFRTQLASQGLHFMPPFSNFEFLRQAFTEGETWPVAGDRLERLLDSKLITREQMERFLAEGAIGSHLENLQRHGGFKGFNQKSVSVIIDATDPRKDHLRGG